MLPTHPTWAADTQTLPKGRHKLGIMFAQTGEIRDTYDADGNSVSLVAPYQLELSSRNFRRADPRVSELVNWLNSNTGYRYDASRRNDPSTVSGIVQSSDPGFANASSLGDALSRGSLGLDAFAQRQQWVFKLQRGLTENWSLGGALQIIKQSIRFNYNIGGVNTAKDIYDGFGVTQTGGPYGTLASGLQLLAKLGEPEFQDILAAKNYDRFEESDKTGIGDFIIGSRYKWKDQDVAPGKWMAAFEGRFTLPTGSLSSPSELVGTDFGAGAYSIMVGHNTSLRLNGRWEDKATRWVPLVGNPLDRLLERIEIYHNIAYTQNFPYQRIRRIRTNPGDFLPDASTEEPVTIALGNSWMQSFGASYSINPTLTFTAQLDWMFKNKDQVLTAAPDTTRANYLAEGTDGQLKTLQLQVNASSIGSFLRGGSPIPGDLSFTLSRPLAGKNQLLTPYGLLELALYF